MKRIIRLTESDLTRIVRRVINEEKTFDEQSITEYGKNVVKTLGKNFQLGASEEDYGGEEVRGTYKSYFIQDFYYGAKWGKDGLDLTFNARMFNNDKNEKLVPCTVSFAIILKDGFPVRIETGFAHYNNEAHSLLDKHLNERILPKIKNIKYESEGTTKSVCPKGFVREKGSKYPFPSPAYCDGTLSKYPNKRIKLYDDKTASVETKNWNHNDFRKNVKQEGKWKTDSLGNPIIYNLGPEEMMTIN